MREPTGRERRSGVIPRVGSYTFHGVGCRFEFETGEEVDFDWNADGAPTFDVWRLRRYAQSINAKAPVDAELLAACRELTAQGLLREASEGWFVLQT
jgi:hypothetical protein